MTADDDLVPREYVAGALVAGAELAAKVRDANQAERRRLEAHIRVLRAVIADLIEGETADMGTPQWYALRNARRVLKATGEGAER